jgi:two-component system cell cycle sensor histidine kinase/response regulator CckA
MQGITKKFMNIVPRAFTPTIRTQMAVIFTILIGLIAVFIFLLFTTKFKNEATNAAIARAQSIGNLTAVSMAFPLQANDQKGVNRVIQATIRNNDLLYIVVKDISGDVINSIYMERAQPAHYLEVQTGISISEDGNLIRIMTPIRYADQPLGEVYMGISLESVNAEFSSFRYVVGVVSLTVFILGFLGVFGVSWVITKPVEEMVKTVESIAAGEYSRRANVSSLDDIGYLAKSINAMLDGIEDRTKALENEIRQRQTAEEKIRQQAALIQVTPDAMILCTLKGQVLSWNKAAQTLYSYSADEAIGMSIHEIMSAENADDYKKAENALVTNGEWRGELRQASRDGTQFTIDSRWILMRDQRENPATMMIINTDITEKKKLEQQFLRAERMQSIGTLAGGIAHDLNNVLAPIILAIPALRKRVADDNGRMMVDSIDISAKRGASIIKQMLSFSRGFDGEKTIVQLKHLTTEFESFLQSTFPRTIQFRRSSVKSPWLISGDLTQLYQVLMNLCLNARDAMPHGGTLTLSLENIVLDELHAKGNIDARPGPYVLLTVTDTGIGIPEGIQHKIYEPFFTTKDVGKGTGLGLSTVLGIVKGHGGFLNLYSELGKGTTFRVYLPALEGTEIAMEEKENVADIPHGHGELILIVDDEPAVREVHRTTLESYGYKVATAIDGTEAIAICARGDKKFSLVLTDVMMPHMDGIATIRALRQLNPGMKFIVASGLVDQEKSYAIASMGKIPFLQKPYSSEQLLHTINNVLHNN